MKKPYQYYKNKYLIGVYKCKEDDDSLVALLDNDREFAEFMEISLNDARVTLRYFFTGQNNKLRYKGMLCEIYFIDIIKLEED